MSFCVGIKGNIKLPGNTAGTVKNGLVNPQVNQDVISPSNSSVS